MYEAFPFSKGSLVSVMLRRSLQTHQSFQHGDVDLGVFEKSGVVVKLKHRFLNVGVVVGVDKLERHLSNARQNVERRFSGAVGRHFDEDVVEADADRRAGHRFVAVVGVDQF